MPRHRLPKSARRSFTFNADLCQDTVYPEALIRYSHRKIPLGGCPMKEEEIRRHAVNRYVNGETPKCIYEDLGRTKQWFFKWLKRYQSGDPSWYLSRSRAPQRKPREISKATREQVIKIRERLQRQSFAQVGVSAIKWELQKIGASLPSDRSINRVLRQEGLIKKKSIRSEGSRIPLLHRGSMPQQHPSSGPGRTSLHQGRWQILFLQHHGLGLTPGLHREPEEQGGQAGRRKPPEVLEVHWDTGLPSTGQCAGVSGQQPLPSLLWLGDQIVPLLRHYSCVYSHRRTLAQWGHREL